MWSPELHSAISAEEMAAMPAAQERHPTSGRVGQGNGGDNITSTSPAAGMA